MASPPDRRCGRQGPKGTSGPGSARINAHALRLGNLRPETFRNLRRLAPGQGMSRLRLLAVIEAYSITGPAKNLLEFVRLSRNEVETTIGTFTRGSATNLFIEQARGQG